jgi:5-methylcytosine-specific restriction protein A
VSLSSEGLSPPDGGLSRFWPLVLPANAPQEPITLGTVVEAGAAIATAPRWRKPSGHVRASTGYGATRGARENHAASSPSSNSGRQHSMPCHAGTPMKLTSLKSRLNTVPGRLKALTGEGWRTQGMGGTERGYGYRWQKARERFLRDHPLCVMCEDEAMATAANIVDHKTPHRGDQAKFWDETNWQSLCAHHHSSHKQRMEREEAGK